MCQIPVFHGACQGSVITAQPGLVSSFLSACGQRLCFGIVLESLNPGQREPHSPGFPQVPSSRPALFPHPVCVRVSCVARRFIMSLSGRSPFGSLLCTNGEFWSFGHTNMKRCRASVQARDALIGGVYPYWAESEQHSLGGQS